MQVGLKNRWVRSISNRSPIYPAIMSSTALLLVACIASWYPQANYSPLVKRWDGFSICQARRKKKDVSYGNNVRCITWHQVELGTFALFLFLSENKNHNIFFLPRLFSIKPRRGTTSSMIRGVTTESTPVTVQPENSHRLTL